MKISSNLIIDKLLEEHKKLVLENLVLKAQLEFYTVDDEILDVENEQVAPSKDNET